MTTSKPHIDELLDIMARLRDRKRGCPWDVEQTFETIAPYTIEEAYEVADAIDRRDWTDLCDELGDLLLQVVFHAQMAAEQGLFEFADVAHAISAKMLRRHPRRPSSRCRGRRWGFWGQWGPCFCWVWHKGGARRRDLRLRPPPRATTQDRPFANNG